MQFFRFSICLLIVVALAGCSTRSISNSGYRNDSQRGSSANKADFSYKGELTEYQILGIDTQSAPTEQDILQTLEKSQDVKLPKNSKILLVQSGAAIPDEGMVQNLEKLFSVGPFSGIPEKDIEDKNYSKLMRLVAAKGGYETIVCYWGILESGKMNKATKTVSWVPVVGWALPDQKEMMRIRLKVALLDVRTGNWEVFMPPTFKDSEYSSIVSRKGVDQNLVQTLKERVYSAAAEELAKRYIN